MIPMPRNPDNSRGATERECLANIARAKSEAEQAKDPSQLTSLGKAFYEAQRKTRR